MALKYDASKLAILLPRDGAQDGTRKIVKYLSAKDITAVQAAYVLGTIHHETAGWMQPIREGAVRYGPNYTNDQSIRAVTAIYNKGIIRTNYALPDGPYNQSYYGRGLVQITWYDNYKRFTDLLGVPLDKNPDLALDWYTSLDITYEGMSNGVFRPGKGTLHDITSVNGYNLARELINGDRKRIGANNIPVGRDIANVAQQFLPALTEKKSWF